MARMELVHHWTNILCRSRNKLADRSAGGPSRMHATFKRTYLLRSARHVAPCLSYIINSPALLPVFKHFFQLLHILPVIISCNLHTLFHMLHFRLVSVFVESSLVYFLFLCTFRLHIIFLKFNFCQSVPVLFHEICFSSLSLKVSP
jgi:hypothetical protein